MRNRIVTIVLILGAATTAWCDDLPEGYRGINWNTPWDSAQTVFSELFGESEQDKRGYPRYADSIQGLSCEIIPSRSGDSTLTQVLERFGCPGEPRHLFDSISATITREVGDYPRVLLTDAHNPYAESVDRLDVWMTKHTVHVLTLRHGNSPSPSVDVLHFSRTCYLAGLKKRKLNDSDLRALAWSYMSVAIRWLDPPYVFASSDCNEDEFPEPDDSTKNWVIPPEITKRKAPGYPFWAEMAGREGTVWVSALVDHRGEVVGVHLARPSGTDSRFDRAALESAWKCRYKPASTRGVPHAVWVTYPIHFKMEN